MIENWGSGRENGVTVLADIGPWTVPFDLHNAAPSTHTTPIHVAGWTFTRWVMLHKFKDFEFLLGLPDVDNTMMF